MMMVTQASLLQQLGPGDHGTVPARLARPTCPGCPCCASGLLVLVKVMVVMMIVMIMMMTQACNPEVRFTDDYDSNDVFRF